MIIEIKDIPEGTKVQTVKFEITFSEGEPSSVIINNTPSVPSTPKNTNIPSEMLDEEF